MGAHPGDRAGEPPVVLDAAAGSPAEQVHDQLGAHIASGRLAPGARLPTVRALAERLGVSTATVAKAYRRLEAAGLTTTATRAGTVVRAQGPRPDEAAVREAAGAMAAAAVAAGLDDAAAHALLSGALLLARRG